MAADRESARRLRALGRVREHTSDSSSELVELRLKPLDGAAVRLRPGTADVDTLWAALVRGHHRPPGAVTPGAGAAGSVRRIWDLGCNIGLTMADMAVRFPAAEVVGVELDADNVELARRNLAPWGGRCRVIHAAVWPLDGEVWYHRWAGATSGYRVAAPERQAEPEGPVAPALSLSSLLEREGGGARIDYVKMDVEGAEKQLLRESVGWAESVRSLKVEVHEPYTVEECLADVAALGFSASRDPRHPAAVVGVRVRPSHPA
ncbi:MAG TPA: FkbM family methyltransferase [Thermoleophilaceae bacterium]